jgi:hypothetical protein
METVRTSPETAVNLPYPRLRYAPGTHTLNPFAALRRLVRRHTGAHVRIAGDTVTGGEKSVPIG